jgi:hypothetical protein
VKILDLSAGHRHIWFDKQNPLVTFLDRRAEVKPDFVCDTRQIPAEVGRDFDLVIFDPPHENLGANSRMTSSYGHSTREDIFSTVIGTGKEALRVTKENGLMALKWNDCAISHERVFSMLEGWEPLIAHGLRMPGRHRTQTYWALLRKKPPKDDQGTS